MRQAWTLHGWLRRGREFVELFALPMVCSLLPWEMTLRLMRFLSRYPWWFRAEIGLSTRHAHRAGFAPDQAAFARRMRWRMLIDGMDCYLVPLRGRSYLRRYVRQEGDALPERGPVMFIGSHHGCGYWFLPHVRDAGFPPSIVAPQLGPHLKNSSLQENLYVRLRHKLLAIAAGTPLVYRGQGQASTVLGELLDAGRSGFGLCDMPTQRADAVEVTLCGRRTKLAQNMFELARAHRAAIVIFSSDTDLFSGERRILFKRLPDDMSPEDCTRAFAVMLDACIARDPAGWRFWEIAPAFFPELAHEVT